MKKYGIAEGYPGRPLTGDEIRVRMNKLKTEAAQVGEMEKVAAAKREEKRKKAQDLLNKRKLEKAMNK